MALVDQGRVYRQTADGEIESPPRQPAAVYVWPNGMVMVFDADGQQMPELQGPLEEVREKVAAACTEATQFPAGRWRGISAMPITREFFKEEENRDA